MTSEVTVNGRSITGWRKYAILVPSFIGAGAVCILTYLALIPVAILVFVCLAPVAILAAVLGGSRGHD